MNQRHEKDMSVIVCLLLIVCNVFSSSVPQGFIGGFGGRGRGRESESGKCEMDTVCPSGWVPFGSHCYLIDGTSDTFGNNEITCNGLDSYLLRIESKEEYDFIVGQLLADGITSNIYTGGTDLVTSGTFNWVSNGEAFNPADYYSAFAASSSGNCIMFVKSTSWELQDLDCTSNAGYICEANAACLVEEEEEEDDGNGGIS